MCRTLQIVESARIDSFDRSQTIKGESAGPYTMPMSAGGGGVAMKTSVENIPRLFAVLNQHNVCINRLLVVI